MAKLKPHDEIITSLVGKGHAITNKNIVMMAWERLEDLQEPDHIYNELWESNPTLARSLYKDCKRILRTKTGQKYITAAKNYEEYDKT